MALLSFIIVNSPALGFDYLPLQVEALNRQQNSDFNVFWIDQGPDPEPLRRLLSAQARFDWQLLHAGAEHPRLAGVICWELVRPFAAVMQAATVAPYFTYLHKECLPAPDFVASLARLLPALEQAYGTKFVAACHQLRSPLSLADVTGPLADVMGRDAKASLAGNDALAQLAAAGGHVWKARVPYDAGSLPELAEQAWAEDAFVMPVALARELALFTAVRSRLWFLDLFNILPRLAASPWASQVRWLRLRAPLIYHLAHPRAFYEYSRDFLAAVRGDPARFGHLALYDMAFQGYDYDEPFIAGKRRVDLGRLGLFYAAAVRSSRGTVSLWGLELDGWHHHDEPGLPELRLSPGGLNHDLAQLSPMLDPMLEPMLNSKLSSRLNPDLAEALAIWAGESPADYPAELAPLYEAEGRRLWLMLQRELQGQARVTYASHYHGRSFAHWRDYAGYADVAGASTRPA